MGASGIVYHLKENQDAENFCSQILTWLEKWKTFAPELESEDVFSIIQELKNAIMLWKQSAPNKNRSSLMTRCHCLIEYFTQIRRPLRKSEKKANGNKDR